MTDTATLAEIMTHAAQVVRLCGRLLEEPPPPPPPEPEPEPEAILVEPDPYDLPLPDRVATRAHPPEPVIRSKRIQWKLRPDLCVKAADALDRHMDLEKAAQEMGCSPGGLVHALRNGQVRPKKFRQRVRVFAYAMLGPEPELQPEPQPEA